MVSSGVAYYKHLKDGGNWGTQPDDYIDTSHGSYMDWEKPGSGTYRNRQWSLLFLTANKSYPVTFGNGTRFTWSIIDDAQSRPNYSGVGNADNSYVQFFVYKDTGTQLYERDGWKCNTIYWAF